MTSTRVEIIYPPMVPRGTKFQGVVRLVWRLTEQHTQAEAARAMGWSRGAVSNYVALRAIDSDAWDIVATTFCGSVAIIDVTPVADVATPVASPFSENLLRNILDLCPAQQLDLCRVRNPAISGPISRLTHCPH